MNLTEEEVQQLREKSLAVKETFEEKMLWLILPREWTQQAQAFVQGRTDCRHNIHSSGKPTIFGTFQAIKEFIDLCAQLNSTEV